MKRFILAILLFVSCMAFAQDTLIVRGKTKNDTIICKVDRLIDNNLYYTKKGVGRFCTLDEIVKFNKGCQNCPRSMNSMIIKADTTRQEWQKNSAGLELKKAGNSFLEGFGFYAAGTATFIIWGTKTNNPNGTGLYIGTGFYLTGFIFQCVSWVHVNRAGRIMIMADKNGLGVALPIK